jgi:selenocysteine lyase/cysteine desulfurase
VDERVTAWRAATPGCGHRVHLNNAGASLMPIDVLDAIRAHLVREAQIGGYEAADESAERVAAVYADLARLIGTAPRNIAVVDSATAAVAQGLASVEFEPGDVLVTTRQDYVSNQLMYLALARRRGVVVRRAAELPEGGVDPDSVRALVRDPRCRLVAVTWVPTNSGLVQPVADVGRVCRDAGVPYLVDACQAVGQLPVDVSTIGCDFLAATARKFLRGPRGIGFLYVSDRVLGSGAYPLFVDMRGATWTGADAFELAPDARRFENWEFPSALVLGLGAAARYALDVGVAEGGSRGATLAASLREGLAALPGARVLDRGPSLCAIVTVTIYGHDARRLMPALRARGVNTSVSPRDVAVLDFDDKGVDAALRLSPHYFNTPQDVDAAVAALAELLQGNR